MKIKIMAIILALSVGAMALAGCASVASDNSSDNGTEAETETEAEASSDASDENGMVGDKASMFSGGSEADKDDADIDAFNEINDADASGKLDNSEDDGWQGSYKKYLEENPREDDTYSYAFIYVDDDDIPELVVDTGVEASGCQILTYHDGMLDVLQTSRLYFAYLEKKNILDNCDGHMGYYYDLVYTIKNGKWELIFDGNYSGFADEDEPAWDEENQRYHVTDYEVNGKKTDEAGYMDALNEVYDWMEAMSVQEYLLYDDVVSYLDTGKLLYETHRYELCVEDCTWEEAEKKCEAKGGYLASLTCDGEFAKVEDMIREENMTNIVFYVGARRNDNYGWEWTEPNLTHRSCLGNGFYKHWLENGPSYTDVLADGTEIDEEYVELLYRKSEDAFYLNDITNDVPGIYPSFKGRIGYICEYPE